MPSGDARTLADSKDVGNASAWDTGRSDLERGAGEVGSEVIVDAPVSSPLDAAADGTHEWPGQDGPMADQALPVDRVADARADLGPSAEAGTVKADGAADSAPAVEAFPCRKDADCCIKIDTCMNVAYLYSKAPGASPEPEIPPSKGWCTACIPPSVQVRCVANRCVGERLPTPSSGPEPTSHCGPLKLPDAGISAHHDLPTDAGVSVPPSRWTCGG